MIRGIYTSASGMLAESLRTDVIANNLANVNTTGYKKDIAVNKDFASLLITRINDGEPAQIGNLGVGALVDEVTTIHSNGSTRQTGNALDLAIMGKGFFAVATPNGLRYTRNGSFARSAQGELVTSEGYRVQGQNGPIRLPDGKLTVGADGTVTVDDQQIGQLTFVEFANEKALQKEGNSLFIAPAGQAGQRATGAIEQGYLEMANVNPVAEMVNLIANYRSYEINGKAVQAHDQLMGKAVNDVGRL